MELLEKNKNYAGKETYQKVAFYHGVALFIDNDYSAALNAFEKSLKNALNNTFKVRAQFWKAESQYRLNRFDMALKSFEEFRNTPSAKDVEEYDQLEYNLGYCHFKQKDYSNASAAFKRATQSNTLDNAMKTDALMRLGDSYFVSSNYKLALSSYNKASKVNGPERDYAAFQKAMSQGFLGNSISKIDGLSQFVSRYPKSSLRDDALFELGNTYVKTNREAMGLQTYENLIKTFP